jgi:hypothetical protein
MIALLRGFALARAGFAPLPFAGALFAGVPFAGVLFAGVGAAFFFGGAGFASESSESSERSAVGFLRFTPALAAGRGGLDDAGGALQSMSREEMRIEWWRWRTGRRHLQARQRVPPDREGRHALISIALVCCAPLDGVCVA